MEAHEHPTAHDLAMQWSAGGRDTELVELITLLRRAATAVTAEPDRFLASHGLSRGQFDVLAALYRSGADQRLTQAELADRMMVTPAGMKKRLDGLFERGIITRSADEADARRQLIALTASGLHTVEAVLDGFFAAERAAVEHLSPADRRTLTRVLRRLVRESR
ncbi:MarR family winged helix-turn-helix transcriptional regulator [Kineococcus sp. SYSU DK003]|uniref:MarR family winged helix-turn-helix transcriptional regulator n=1 Tax=Kineococcus sp. SYSU DK003 TaxID=3383124 RepID=UPI003D7CFE88